MLYNPRRLAYEMPGPFVDVLKQVLVKCQQIGRVEGRLGTVPPWFAMAILEGTRPSE